MRNKHKVIKILSSAAFCSALALTLSACNTKPNQAPSHKQVKKAAQNSKEALDTNLIKISENDALSKFNAKYKDKKITNLDLKPSGKKYVYEINAFDASREYKMKIDANSGKILRSKTQSKDLDEQLEHGLNTHRLISRKTANKIAEKHVKQGSGYRWQLKRSDDKSVWDVYIINKDEKQIVKVDAKSQKVISTTKE